MLNGISTKMFLCRPDEVAANAETETSESVHIDIVSNLVIFT